jgi:hypothetical protein
LDKNYYIIVNTDHPLGPVLCDEESALWEDQELALQMRDSLRAESGNSGIEVYEVPAQKPLDHPAEKMSND